LRKYGSGSKALDHETKEDDMSKKKYQVRAECPQCACGDVSFLGPEKLREKFIGDENEIDILCPLCGTKHKGKVVSEED
jgi:Zn finger protein HypA/HybF involved in hydrogenase expression